jgi:hypothetical protein
MTVKTYLNQTLNKMESWINQTLIKSHIRKSLLSLLLTEHLSIPNTKVGPMEVLFRQVIPRRFNLDRFHCIFNGLYN